MLPSMVSTKRLYQCDYDYPEDNKNNTFWNTPINPIIKKHCTMLTSAINNTWMLFHWLLEAFSTISKRNHCRNCIITYSNLLNKLIHYLSCIQPAAVTKTRAISLFVVILILMAIVIQASIGPSHRTLASPGDDGMREILYIYTYIYRLMIKSIRLYPYQSFCLLPW